MVLIAQRVVPRFLRKNDRRDGTLLLTLNGDSNPQHREKVLELLHAKLPGSSLESISYAENTATIHLSFNGMNSNGLNGLHESLNRIAPVHKLNVYFNRQSTLPL